MTDKEALELVNDYEYQGFSWQDDMVDCIKLALEKQIPKKPLYKYVDPFGTGREYLASICPICNWEFEVESNFCEHCGQKMNWSEEDGNKREY